MENVSNNIKKKNMRKKPLCMPCLLRRSCFYGLLPVVTSRCYDMKVCFDAGVQKTTYYTSISKQIINQF